MSNDDVSDANLPSKFEMPYDYNILIGKMALPIKYYRWLRNTLFGVVVIAPFLGYYYVNSNMKRMEKGVTDDLKRI